MATLEGPNAAMFANTWCTGLTQKIVLQGGVCDFVTAPSGAGRCFVPYGASKSESVAAAADTIGRMNKVTAPRSEKC